MIQPYTKVLEGPPPIQILISPQNVTLTADEVGFVTPIGYSPANTTLQVKEGEDFYYTPEGYKCFTEKYHLKRGYCCKSGCRHCPYGFDKKTGTNKKQDK